MKFYHKTRRCRMGYNAAKKSFMCKNNLLLFCFLFFLAALFCGCSHEKLPTVSTGIITDISSTEATASGTVLDDGTDVIVRGLCYSFSDSLPSIDGLHTTDGSGPGGFSSQLSDLQPNTTYYVRAYATNSIGTAYGNTVKFTTLDGSELSNYAQMLCIPQGWVMSAAVSTPAYLLANGTVVSNLFEGYLYDFETDDIIVFNTDGTIIANPGNLIPDYDFDLSNGEYGTDEFPHTTSVIGNWSFIGENEPPTEISMQIPFFYDRFPEVCRIISLSDNELIVKYSLDEEEGLDKSIYDFTIYYVPPNFRKYPLQPPAGASEPRRGDAC